MDEHRLDLFLERARQREPKFLAALCERIYPKLLKYMGYRVSRDVADDLAGDVVVRVLQNIHRQKGRFDPWLYTIARNVVIDYFRARKARKEAPMEHMTTAVALNGGDPARAVGNRVDIEDALAWLTDEQHELVTLKFMQGLSTADVAQITGRREGAVRALQFRALSALRDVLGEDGKKS